VVFATQCSFYGSQENGLRRKRVDDFCVSISHSKEVALAGLSYRGNRVGVDVEKVDRNITEEEIRQVYNT